MGGYSHERKHLVFLMQTRGKKKKTDTWQVRNGENQLLAYVVYRPGWRRYVLRFPPNQSDVDFDSKCLQQALIFLEEETLKLKAEWKKRKEG